jgi:protease I
MAVVKTDSRNAGAECVDRIAVVDGNLLTIRRPDDIPAFNREMLGCLRRLGSALTRDRTEPDKED